MLKVQVLYFAELAEVAGRQSESVNTEAVDLAALYQQLQARYSFRFAVTSLRAARNGEFAAWSCPIENGDEIAFMPPFSGG